MNCYPIKLSYHVRSYSFGERLIPQMLNKTDVPDGVVAETWEISDYPDARATVKNGAYTGEVFHELVQKFPDELVGEGWRGPHFPLLEKFLDASHMLPVHLHADDETARTKHNEPHGKTEAWHILWAGEGASILAGIKDGLEKEDLLKAFKSQDYDSVMFRHPISQGDTIYVPAGILHTFGPDALVFEVQQTSDLGQFVMPEDLYGNLLTEEEWDANIEATLDELNTHFKPRPNPGLALSSGANDRVVCCAGPYFAMERWSLTEPYIEAPHPERCLTLSNVGQAVRVEYSDGVESLAPGESCVLPAAIGEVNVIPEDEASLIACYVPDMERDVVTPLREAGYSDAEIESLGEVNVL
ncbi:class I mannose-6-phosphate isomerase [soil metagenome]